MQRLPHAVLVGFFISVDAAAGRPLCRNGTVTGHPNHVHARGNNVCEKRARELSAAMVISGQLRTFGDREVHSSLARLKQLFRTDVFAFLSLVDSFVVAGERARAGVGRREDQRAMSNVLRRRSMDEPAIVKALKVLDNVVAVRTFNDSDVPCMPISSCHRRVNASVFGHWSHFWPMFWAMREGFKIVQEHETNLGTTYDVVVRARPDIIVELSGDINWAQWRPFETLDVHYWFDVLAIMHRSVANAYFATALYFQSDRCAQLPNEDERTYCDAMGGYQPKWTSQCFLRTILKMHGVCERGWLLPELFRRIQIKRPPKPSNSTSLPMRELAMELWPARCDAASAGKRSPQERYLEPPIWPQVVGRTPLLLYSQLPYGWDTRRESSESAFCNVSMEYQPSAGFHASRAKLISQCERNPTISLQCSHRHDGCPLAWNAPSPLHRKLLVFWGDSQARGQAEQFLCSAIGRQARLATHTFNSTTQELKLLDGTPAGSLYVHEIIEPHSGAVRAEHEGGASFFMVYAKQLRGSLGLTKSIVSELGKLLRVEQLKDCKLVLIACSQKAHQPNVVLSKEYYGTLKQALDIFSVTLPVERIYYRPATAVHFAAPDGEYHGRETDVGYCGPLADSAREAARNRSAMETQRVAMLLVSNMVVVPHAYELSEGLYFAHPAVHQAADGSSRTITGMAAPGLYPNRYPPTILQLAHRFPCEQTVYTFAASTRNMRMAFGLQSIS